MNTMNLTRLVKSMTQGVMYLDSDGAVLAMNPAAERLLGTQASALVGRDVLTVPWQATHEDGSPVKADEYPVRVAMRTGRPVIGHLIGMHAHDTGTLHWLRVSVTPESETPAGQSQRLFVTFEDVTELRAAGDEVAAALQREREARAAAEQTSARLAALQAVTDAALTQLNLDNLLGEMLQRLCEVLSVENAAILLLDETGQTLHVRAVKGPEQAVASQVAIQVGAGFAGRIAATGMPWIVDDIKAIPVVTQLLKVSLSSIAGVPLRAGDRVIGVVHIGTAEPHSFSQDEVALLEAAASRIGVAIEHARLYDDLAKAHAETQRLVESLRTSESRFRGIYEQAAVGIAMVSLDGRWMDVNARLCEIVGYTREELLNLSFQDITYAPDLHADLDYVRRVRDGEMRAYTMEKRYIRKDGSLVWIKLSVAAVRDSAGATQAFISVIEEVDDLKRAEESLRELNATLERRVRERTAELRAANEEMEAFAYSVSHDLRAPLRAMEGFARALEEDYSSGLDATAREYMGRIVGAAGRMDQLIADLLTYSRISREQVEVGPLSLATVAQRVVADMNDVIQMRHAEVMVAPHLPDVTAQRVVLEQVLTNLVSNALTFVASGIAPRVCLWAECVQMPGDETVEPESWVRLWVEDNGIGINPEYHQRIFRVFERLHGNEQYPGTGIGLAIVRRGMERLGGRAGVESLPGAGSRFWIEMRAAKPREDDESC